MKTKSPALPRLLALVVSGLLGLLALWSCKLGAEVEVEEVFTFPALADSLAGNDHAVIFLKDTTGGLLDTLFNGPITPATRFENLVARKYKGGKITVVIEGYKGGTLNYKVEKLFNGAVGRVDSTLIVVPRPVSGAKVDSVQVGPDTAVVVVVPTSSKAVDSVTVSPDTLLLYTGGEALSLTAALHPDTLPFRIAWRSAQPGIAAVDTAGKVRPVAVGRTYVSAISLADSTRRDSALVLVRKDPPRIQIGPDTTISVGQTLTYLPVLTQDFGLITMVRWDLDGNGTWDDSSTAPKSVSYRYAEAKEYATRFSARDSEGNDTTVTRKVRSVSGPVILFTQPADGSHTNQNPITVTWSVDGVVQTSPEALKPGANVITRSASAAGGTYSASITVHFDTVPPARPLVKGPRGPVSSLRPAWSWEPTGGGNGTFRFRLDSDNFTVGATVGTDTTFTPGANLTGGSHTLYVQERDQAGNWSQSGSFTVSIDTTPPPPPVVTVLPASPTNNRRPTWSWTGSASEGRSTYRYKLDNRDFRTGATLVSTAGFTPAPGAELQEGTHVLYVQHQDSAGNWSAEGSGEVRIDLTAPTAPTVTGPASPTQDDTPTWTWTAGTGGSGTFRYRLDDTTMAGGSETSQPSYTPTALPAGSHTLHVQERDSAGNWSPRGAYSVVLDRTPPNPPTMNVSSPRSPLNSLRPTWSWTSGGGGNGTYQVKVGNDDFSTGATTITATSYTPPANLGQGAQTLYVRERDAAENWSTAASRTIFLAPRGTLGGRGLSQGESGNPLLLVTSTGEVYAAYRNWDKNLVEVKRYQPGTDIWVDAGIGMDMTGVDDFTLAPGDVPYIVGSSSVGIHVKRLVGATWQDVGNPEDNAKKLDGPNPTLAINSLGIPYLAFKYLTDFTEQVSLMHFSGTDWRLAKSLQIGTPFTLDLTFGANDRPYLGFLDLKNWQAYVVTTDLNNHDSKWDTVGSGPASSKVLPSSLRIATHSDQVYLGLASFSSPADIQVLASNGGSFATLLSIKGVASGSDFTVSPEGIPYLAMYPEYGGERLAIMGYFGSTWINVGGEFKFADPISTPNLAVSGDGVPYVGFSKGGGGISVIRTSFDPDP